MVFASPLGLWSVFCTVSPTLCSRLLHLYLFDLYLLHLYLFDLYLLDLHLFDLYLFHLYLFDLYLLDLYLFDLYLLDLHLFDLQEEVEGETHKEEEEDNYEKGVREDGEETEG